MQAVSEIAAPPSARRAWIVWGLAASAYLVAIFHRMALGVAGLEATERLAIPESSLAYLAALQLLVYLLMQVPAGLAADRLGPRRTLALGLAVMAAGELVFALAHGVGPALAGRALVGAGDALTFLNVLRIAHAWFPARRQGLLAALTGVVGAVGQLAATTPLHLALDGLGWSTTFLAASALTALLVLVPLALLQDRPAGQPPPAHGDHEPVGRTLAAAWRRPATRHGFFLHLGAMAPFAIVGAVWGVPYMVGSQGMTRAAASAFLLAMVASFAAAGPVIGALAGHDPERQRRLSIVVPTASTIGWGLLVAWPTPQVPRPLLLLVLAVTGAAAGASMLAFEIARREAPPVAAGSATALVNCGGFSGAVLGALAVGALLGVGDGPAATQHAMAPVLVAAAVGAAGSLRHARRDRPPVRGGERLLAVRAAGDPRT